MSEKSNLLLGNMLNAKTEFEKAKHEYINAIQEFYGNAIENIHISFHRNKMYITFNSWDSLDDRYLLKFCNKFGFLAPTVKFEELSENFIIYEWKFIKILG